mmetsp:Transcript_30195/g.48761  ORF Transcript_30195/g.48761 Transcript_30195/m.48761 type:complete len:105 (+) Transcript_30195:71-385(+)
MCMLLYLQDHGRTIDLQAKVPDVIAKVRSTYLTVCDKEDARCRIRAFLDVNINIKNMLPCAHEMNALRAGYDVKINMPQSELSADRLYRFLMNYFRNVYQRSRT